MNAGPKFPRDAFLRLAPKLTAILLLAVLLAWAVRFFSLAPRVESLAKAEVELRDRLAYERRQLETLKVDADAGAIRTSLDRARARLTGTGLKLTGSTAAQDNRVMELSRMTVRSGLVVLAHGSPRDGGTPRLSVRELEVSGSFAAFSTLVEGLANSPEAVRLLRTRVVRADRGLTVSLLYSL